LIEKLNNASILYSNLQKDQRINSINDESTIIKKIINLYKTNKFLNYKLDIGPPRHWYDFALINNEDNDDIIPFNIKVSSLNTDNISSKKGIFYALTGENPENHKIDRWDSFMKKIFELIPSSFPSYKDYYFLVFNKKVINDCYWTSLKNLNELNSNASNLPFQSNWEKNRTRKERVYLDAVRFILTSLNKSHIKRFNSSQKVNILINEFLSNLKN
jgi:hypothetical protein